MGESANTHQHTSPATVAPSAPPPNLALSRGPTWTPAEQLQQLHYCIHSNPSWPEAVLLAFQHYIVVLGTIVLIATTLVPRMGGSPGDKARVIQTLLFTAGLNTLLQTALGSRLPTVMRSSFVFILPVLSIINDFSDKNFSSEHERFTYTVRTIQGSLIVASIINIILGFSRTWGHLTRLFTPVVIVPLVCVVGLGLFMRGFPMLANCVEIGLPMLILLVIGQQYLRRIHHRADVVLERFGLLICIALIWAFAAILTVAGAYNHVREVTKQSCRTDRSFLMSSAPWIRVPYPFQWGTPIFRASHVFGMMGATLVASAESTGTFFAAARLSGATPPPSYIFNRSIGLQGIGLLVEGIFGCIAGNSASVENVGLLGLTHIGSRRVVQISTAFMIFFSIFGKFGAFFASIPLPIFGAIYCVLFGIVAATGISFMQFTNNNSMRNLYIIGLSLFLGISIPQYFVSNTSQDGRGPVQTAGGWVSQKREPLIIHSFLLLFVYPFNRNSFVMQFNDILNTIFSSAPTIAIIIGTVLDQTLDAKPSVNDRGVSWWKPFQHKKGDVRNDEFYGLPLRINEYIPTRFH
uniref:Nucleobase-ascorbate transporter 3 n=1 Tax=Cucumis melo TaxID=3656 RepID=A0A9I9DD52_CUCME